VAGSVSASASKWELASELKLESAEMVTETEMHRSTPMEMARARVMVLLPTAREMTMEMQMEMLAATAR
jgi:hypothetical protein